MAMERIGGIDGNGANLGFEAKLWAAADALRISAVLICPLDYVCPLEWMAAG